MRVEVTFYGFDQRVNFLCWTKLIKSNKNETVCRHDNTFTIQWAFFRPSGWSFDYLTADKFMWRHSQFSISIDIDRDGQPQNC